MTEQIPKKMYLDPLLLLLLLQAVTAGNYDDDASGNDGASKEEDKRLPRTRVVRTKYGLVQGRVHHLGPDLFRGGEDYLAGEEEVVRGSDRVEVFQGIRYATPPVGTNR